MRVWLDESCSGMRELWWDERVLVGLEGCGWMREIVVVGVRDNRVGISESCGGVR